MKELFRSEEISHDRSRTDEGVIEVFFDDGQSVLLETAEPKEAYLPLSDGLLNYKKLHLADGLTLTPAQFDEENLGLVHLAEKLDVVVGFAQATILRSPYYKNNMTSRFVDIVTAAASDDTKAYWDGVIDDEERLLEFDVAQSMGNMLGYNDDLWVRLEAGRNPDKQLVGKVIIARIACLVTLDGRVGLVPQIFDTEGVQTAIPEQLSLHDTWLYTEDRSEEQDVD